MREKSILALTILMVLVLIMSGVHAQEATPDTLCPSATMVPKAQTDTGGSKKREELFIEQITCIIKKNPYDANAYSKRGFAFLFLGEFQEALSDFDRFISLEPESVNLQYAYLGRALAQRGLGFNQKALDDIDKAIELAPEEASYYLEQGNIYLALHAKLLAVDSFTRAIRLEPRNARAYSDRGFVNQSLGNFAAAQGDFDQAIRLDPNISSQYIVAGNFALTHQQYAQAIHWFSQALQLNLIVYKSSQK